MDFLGPVKFSSGHCHSLGRRCWCGHLTIPVGFHTRDDKGRVVEDGKGEAAYLEWLGSASKPDYVNPPVMAEVLATKSNVRKSNIVPVTKSKRGGKRKGSGRHRVHESNADRKAAYRRRHGHGHGQLVQ